MFFYKRNLKLYIIGIGIAIVGLLPAFAMAMTRTEFKEGIYSIAGRTFPPSLNGVRQRREVDPRLIVQIEASDLEQGLRLERFALAEDTRQAYGTITLVRVDTRLFALSILSSPAQWRSPSQWLEQNGFSAAINAGMHDTNGNSAGLLISNSISCNENTQNFSGRAFLGLNPVDPELPSAVIFHQKDPDFDLASMRRNYRDIVQNMQMLDDHGADISWEDSSYHSTTAVAIDSEGPTSAGLL